MRPIAAFVGLLAALLISGGAVAATSECRVYSEDPNFTGTGSLQTIPCRSLRARSQRFCPGANGVVMLPYSPVGWFETSPGELLNLELSASNAYGVLAYTEK